MKVRGRRECVDCGARWSYYETGSVTCPDCGSVRSRGLDDERRLHTAGPAELDLSAVRTAVDERPLPEVADGAKATCLEYLRERGFVRAGELLPLDDTYLAAGELVHVADVVGRTMDLGDDEEWYLLELLGGADAGERPAPDEVPGSLRAARGLAVVDAVEDYRSELREWLDEHPHPEATEPLAMLGEHGKRMRALQGDVPPAAAERLLSAVRDLSRYLRTGEEEALPTARERLDRLTGFHHD